MIYFPATKGNISTELPVDASSTISAEGQCLVASTPDGNFGAKPSAGSGSEVFLGVAVSQQITLTAIPRAEAFTQGASDAIQTSFTPNAGTVAVYDVTAGALLTGGGTDYTQTGKDITLLAATRGHELLVHYTYAPTAVQARAYQGDIVPGGPAGAALSQVGIIRNGIVYTDQYDTTVDWTQANPVVKTGAGGKFTIGGSGTTLTNVSVIAAPVANFPYLGLLLN